MTAPAVIVVTPAELEELVAEAVRGAIADALDASAPALLTQEGIAQRLDVTTATIRNLTKRGMPELRVGTAPRYELDAVLAWLREQRRPA